MTRYRMDVDGMTCDSCDRHVAGALAGAGATDVSAHWRKGEARFSAEEGDLERLSDAVRGVGYRPKGVEAQEVAANRTARSEGKRTDYDLLAIGAGGAAFAAAIRATNLGARVGIVEGGTIGGTCVNTGCVPSKNLLAAAEAYHTAGHHQFPGIATSQDGVDLPAAMGMKDEVVSYLRGWKYEDLAEKYGFEIIRGDARFTGPDSVAVDGREIRAGHYLVATGARPWAPPIPGLEESGYLTSTTALELKDLPETIVVIGGNYIGLEMGQLFSRLGTRVTIVEALDRLAPLEEPEVSEWISLVLDNEGIEIVTSANITRVEGGGESRVVHLDDGRRFEADEVLVATGRRPYTEGLGLDVAGIELTERGAVKVDDELRTTNPRVFAGGDVTEAPQFVYVAAAHGTIAAENAVNDGHRKVDYTAMPRVTFTQPQIAAVGLTDEEANRQGYRCECRVVELKDIPRPLVNKDTRGAFKIVAEQGSGRILGVHIVGPGAGDVIIGAVYAVKFGLRVQDLADTWAPYLTMAEGLKLTAQSFTSDIEMLSCCAA
ncbi:MAG: mercury(II) reductase [Actinomycetota bacterium]